MANSFTLIELNNNKSPTTTGIRPTHQPKGPSLSADKPQNFSIYTKFTGEHALKNAVFGENFSKILKNGFFGLLFKNHLSHHPLEQILDRMNRTVFSANWFKGEKIWTYFWAIRERVYFSAIRERIYFSAIRVFGSVTRHPWNSESLTWRLLSRSCGTCEIYTYACFTFRLVYIPCRMFINVQLVSSHCLVLFCWLMFRSIDLWRSCEYNGAMV